MPDDSISAFLKLFCILESGEVPLEPSWQSWFIFCLFLLGSVLLAICGVYFDVRHINLSAIFCFTFSAAGFGMTLVALLAILLGYNRRRRCRATNRNSGVDIHDARPAIPEESVWVNIEKDVLESSHNVQSTHQWMNPLYVVCDQPSTHNAKSNQQWMNSVYVDGDQPLYETKTEPYEADDFEEKDSNYFYSSSETRTSYSSPDDDDSYQITSEGDLNEMGERYFGNNQYCGWMDEQILLENGRVAERKRIPNQESKLDQFQVYLHYKMTSIQISEVRNRGQKSSRKFKDENLLNEKLHPVESDYCGNLDNLENCFHSNSAERRINPNLEDKLVKMYITECQNDRVDLNLETYAQPKDVNLRHESNATLDHSNNFFQPKLVIECQNAQLTSTAHEKDPHITDVYTRHDNQAISEPYNSFCPPKSYKDCQNNRNAMIMEDDHFSVININDSQSTAESCDSFLISKQMPCQNGNKALVASGRNVAEISQANVEHCNSIFPSKLPAECWNENEIITRGKNYPLSKVQHCDVPLSSRSKLGSPSNNPTAGNFFATQRDIQHHSPSRQTLDFPEGFTSHVYPDRKLSDTSNNAGRKRWKWSERNEDIPRIKKRPLLDANGNPISQYELVKVLTELLQNGRQQFPKQPVETSV